MIRFSELEALCPWLVDGGVEPAQALADLTAAYVKLKGEQDGEEEARAEYVEAAQRHRLLREGTLEVDDNAIVSFSEDGGAYVQAWLWIDAEEFGISQEEEEEDDINEVKPAELADPPALVTD